jgi:hypothetical protein
MSKFSDYLEDKILDATLKGGTFPTIATAYLATFTGDPTDTGSASTENTWANTAGTIVYARQPMTFGAISDGVTNTSAQIQFPAFQTEVPAVSSLSVGFIGIYDAASGGNLLYHTNLGTAKTLTQDDVLSFETNGVTVTLT